VATNCCVIPARTVRPTGVTASETRVAGVTVTFAVPLTPLGTALAVIVVVPRATPVASPAEVIVATDVDDEVQVTPGDTSTCFVPSLKTAVAVNGCEAPSGSFFVAGVTASDVGVALLTVMVAVLLTGAFDDVLLEAVMVAVPGATATTSPALETVATVGLLVVHFTVLARFFVVPLSNDPVA
jgi:hypothetical protein